jgi:hypothetical protein
MRGGVSVKLSSHTKAKTIKERKKKKRVIEIGIWAPSYNSTKAAHMLSYFLR